MLPPVDSKMDNIFPKLPPTMSVKDKVLVSIQRYECDYFVNMTEEQSALYPVEVRPKPGVIVTPALYKLHVKRARKTAHMKLRWALNSSELFACSFQIKLRSTPAEGGFSGTFTAERAAADLYSKFSQEYQVGKAVVKTAVDDAGKKTRKVQKMKKTGETRDDFERRRKQEKTETAQHQVLTDILNAIWQPEFRNQLQQAGRARSVRAIQERIDVQHISNQVENYQVPDRQSDCLVDMVLETVDKAIREKIPSRN